MARNQQATQAVHRQPSTEDFSSELQGIGQRVPAESTSDDEDEDYNDNPL